MPNDIKRKNNIREKQFNFDFNCSNSSIIITDDTITINDDGVTTITRFYSDMHLRTILHFYFSTSIMRGTNPSVVSVFRNNNGIYDKKFTLFKKEQSGNRAVIVVSNMKQTMIIEDELVSTFGYDYDYNKKLILSY